MDMSLFLFLLSDLSLAGCGYYFGWRFWKRDSILLSFEWWIVAVSASSFFLYAISQWSIFYSLSIFLDAFSRWFGFPVIVVVGVIIFARGVRLARWLEIALFVVGFLGAYIWVTYEVLAPVKPWVYLILAIWFAGFSVYLAAQLFSFNKKYLALFLFLVVVFNLFIAIAYDFYHIPWDDEHRTTFYTLALASWALLLTAYYYACEACLSLRRR
ncbi:hypothetical protein [Tepidimonas taiwanensis]|uniref:hypothetical protein n=1 Tax=Tepidimonas taiwanensis TaxID=307486 RepID=UPI0012E02244|nr:hypothetical protein [Tepidimonas taiwanensis]